MYRIFYNKFLLFCVFVFTLFFNISACFGNDNAKCKEYSNFAIIVSGPSGAGKTTIVNEVLKRNKTLSASISAVTRQKRKGEKEGVDYYFLTRDEFKELIGKGEFLEYDEHYGNFYGTPRRNYIESIKNSKDIIFNVNASGMRSIKKNKKIDVISIFIVAPSEDVLKKRLINRGTENMKQLKTRIDSMKSEMKNAKEYDYVLLNDTVDNAVKVFEAIYNAEKYKRIICK